LTLIESLSYLYCWEIEVKESGEGKQSMKTIRWVVTGLLPVMLLIATGKGLSQVWVRAVDVPCVVTDKQGRFVSDLSRSDLLVYDNGRLQKITNFKKKLQSPLRIAFLLDRSRSVAKKFSLLQHASAKFLSSIVRQNVDRACLISFDSHVYLLQGWTDGVDQLTEMIGRLTPAGGTALFDALYKTCRDMFPPNPDDSTTRVVVLVTDGEDTTSRATFKEIRGMVPSSGAMIYVLGIKAEESLNARELQGKQVLAELRDVSGGAVLYPNTNQDRLDTLFEQIEQDLRNAYAVGFTSYEEPDGTFHKIKVESSRKDLIVRPLKKGYYNS
jgi:Ca-activated chloride channel family protein